MGYGSKTNEQHKDWAYGKKSLQFVIEVVTEKIWRNGWRGQSNKKITLSIEICIGKQK